MRECLGSVRRQGWGAMGGGRGWVGAGSAHTCRLGSPPTPPPPNLPPLPPPHRRLQPHPRWHARTAGRPQPPTYLQEGHPSHEHGRQQHRARHPQQRHQLDAAVVLQVCGSAYRAVRPSHAGRCKWYAPLHVSACDAQASRYPLLQAGRQQASRTRVVWGWGWGVTCHRRGGRMRV